MKPRQTKRERKYFIIPKQQLQSRIISHLHFTKNFTFQTIILHFDPLILFSVFSYFMRQTDWQSASISITTILYRRLISLSILYTYFLLVRQRSSLWPLVLKVSKRVNSSLVYFKYKNFLLFIISWLVVVNFLIIIILHTNTYLEKILLLCKWHPRAYKQI